MTLTMCLRASTTTICLRGYVIFVVVVIMLSVVSIMVVVIDSESLSLLFIVVVVRRRYQRHCHFVIVIHGCDLCVYHSAATSNIYSQCSFRGPTKHLALDVTSTVVVVACRVVVSSVLTSTLTLHISVASSSGICITTFDVVSVSSSLSSLSRPS